MVDRRRQVCPVCWRGISVGAVDGRFRAHHHAGTWTECRASGLTLKDMECWVRYGPRTTLPPTLSSDAAWLLRTIHQGHAEHRPTLVFRKRVATRELVEAGLIRLVPWDASAEVAEAVLVDEPD